MRRFILSLSFLALPLCAVEYQAVHSSAYTYGERVFFKNSLQKKDGTVLGFGGDIHAGPWEVRLGYEKGDTATYQPPLPCDLKVEKLFLRVGYDLDEKWGVSLRHINIFRDNLAPTDDGKTYGLGVRYTHSPALSAHLSQYMTRYDDFDVYQTEGRIEKGFKKGEWKIKAGLLGQYIHIDKRRMVSFVKNAKPDYYSGALQLHAHYATYHLGCAAFFGKRLFAVMNDGFKIQHHAMEFDRTYAVGAGKTLGRWIVRMQYIYQRAKELPQNHPGVTVRNTRLILNYRF
ncbi:hypothetical protein [Hydrogenimonas sp.]